jgi:Protein of unknown function (DUF2905)
MRLFLTLLIGAILALALVGYLADQRAKSGDTTVTPGLALLPGDIKYESPSGNVRVYFPITTSIVLSIILSLAMRFFS